MLWALISCGFRYRFQYDGRLQRSLETGRRVFNTCRNMELMITLAVMLMETFDRLSRKEKYVWDVSTPGKRPEYRNLTMRCFQMYGHVGSDVSSLQTENFTRDHR